jgi:uncharacterized membrane protein YbhN (UPF0104 family)
VGAIWVLRRELREVPLHDILRTLAAISSLRLALALALTVAVLGALLAYRVIYYLIPLAVAAILLGAHEVSRLTHKRRAAHSRA